MSKGFIHRKWMDDGDEFNEYKLMPAAHATIEVSGQYFVEISIGGNYIHLPGCNTQKDMEALIKFFKP